GKRGCAHPDGGVRLHLLAAARSPGGAVAALRGTRRFHRSQDAEPAATVLPQGGLPSRGLGADRPSDRAVAGHPVGLNRVSGGAMSAARNDLVIVGGGSITPVGRCSAARAPTACSSRATRRSSPQSPGSPTGPTLPSRSSSLNGLPNVKGGPIPADDGPSCPRQMPIAPPMTEERANRTVQARPIPTQL